MSAKKQLSNLLHDDTESGGRLNNEASDVQLDLYMRVNTEQDHAMSGSQLVREDNYSRAFESNKVLKPRPGSRTADPGERAKAQASQGKLEER